jgi:Ser/Thr protein kinase RdoA (MazF antagonist)
MQHPYAALTPDKVLDAVESTGLLSDARTLTLNSYENRVYQIGVEDGDPVVAKFYRPERWTTEAILEEHRFTHELADLELPVVPPSIIDGKTLHEFDGFRFSLFPRRGGQAPELDNMDNLLILGRFIGRMHAVGATKPFEHRPNIDIQSYAIDSREFLLNNDFIPKDLLPAYESLSRDLIIKLEQRFSQFSGLTNIRLHADCHPGNILWRHNAPNFVDFDDCRMGPAIQDIWMLLSGDRQDQQMQLSEIIEGYNEFFDFNPVELNLIESFRTLRIMHYSAWLARRWTDPAFPHNFPWFNTERYWSEHILELREQFAMMDELPLALY